MNHVYDDEVEGKGEEDNLQHRVTNSNETTTISFIECMKYQLFPYTNGNFIDYVIPMSSNLSDHHQQDHKRINRSLSTYDYLLVHWKTATESLLYTGSNHDSNNEDTNVAITTTSSYFHDWFHKLWKLHTNYQERHYHTVVHLEEMCCYLEYIVQMHELSSTTMKNNGSCSAISNENRNNDTEKEIRKKSTSDEQNHSVTATVSSVKLSPLSIVLLCIFFHDAIYDPQSTTNEEDSAVLFQNFIQHTNLYDQQQKQISTYILATKSHTIPHDLYSGDNENADEPTLCGYHPLHLFLDLDMAVLGKDPIAYFHYTACIRKEYSFVPSSTYCTKRADILQQFLSNSSPTFTFSSSNSVSRNIYHTKICYLAFEEQARYNLKQEISDLRKGIIRSV